MGITWLRVGTICKGMGMCPVQLECTKVWACHTDDSNLDDNWMLFLICVFPSLQPRRTGLSEELIVGTRLMRAMRLASAHTMKAGQGQTC